VPSVMYTLLAQAPEVYRVPGFHDPFSSISHLFGAGVFAVLGVLLLRRGRGDRARLIYLSIYAGSVVLLLSISGVFHMMQGGGAARRVLERIDHSAIFLLIAGTFTPIHGLLFRGRMRWVPLVIIWVAAILGITLKSIFFDEVPTSLGLALYLTLGWFGTLAGVVLARRYGFAFVAPLVWGGLAYSIGGAIDLHGQFVLLPGLVHPHEVFHLAVLIGVLFHWLFIWQFAGGRLPRLQRAVESAGRYPDEVRRDEESR
jgi:channel protein (hemolysin III family)